jgi:hypothetical protein
MMLTTLTRRDGGMKVRNMLRRFYGGCVVVQRLVCDAQLHAVTFMRQHFVVTHHCARRTSC